MGPKIILLRTNFSPNVYTISLFDEGDICAAASLSRYSLPPYR